MSCFRRAVTVVEATMIRAILWTLTRHLRRRHTVRGRGASAMRLIQLLTLLVVGGGLRVRVIILFPLAMALWGCGRGTFFPITGGLLGSSKSSGRGGCTSGDTTRR